ncbi:MAG: hypothetical protein ACI95C_002977 [Pseudohongiellaceae bacterium]|jgi:uncharacterized protein (TIGR00369 family)
MTEKLTMSPFGDLLGIELVSMEDGKAVCAVQLQPCHLNNGGRVHGGLLTSLADTAAGVAVRSKRPDGKVSATTDLSIAFIRPPAGDRLIATAEVIHAGKRLFRTEISIHCADKLIAKTSATFMIVDAPKTSS